MSDNKQQQVKPFTPSEYAGAFVLAFLAVYLLLQSIPAAFRQETLAVNGPRVACLAANSFPYWNAGLDACARRLSTPASVADGWRKPDIKAGGAQNPAGLV